MHSNEITEEIVGSFDSVAGSTLDIIIPGASFKNCENSPMREQRIENENEVKEALSVFNRMNTTNFGFLSAISKKTVADFFELKNFKIIICFKSDCNHAITYDSDDADEAARSWASLAQFLYCRHKIFIALESDRANTPASIHEEMKIELDVREIFMSEYFPDHLITYLNQPHIVNEGSRY